ncbi:insulinase family protein [Leptospira selangorensis]|uniref:Insulinase family protein n=1 Tax=Leptospira selangorensis TaxID=2484982 RepID=A0A5F2C543_9LEPT|nr:pitrilysin family protein [Leptospira selangorensis]TGM14159.1 insulinase family protein [Leptospira selangorensis]TGM26908.1 insulinase family protein [Leptospira selangorensis]
MVFLEEKNHKITLGNGLVVLFQRAPYSVSVSMGVYVKVGSRSETLENAGYCHFLEHMLFKDTEKRTAKQQAEDWERVGAYSNAATSREYTYFHATLASRDLELGLELLSEMMFQPLFRDQDIRTEAEVVLEEMKGYEDSPEDAIHDFYYNNLFRENSLGRDIIGTEASIRGVTPTSLRKFYETYYHPENMILSLSGNYEPEFVFDLISKYFSHSVKKGKEGTFETPKKEFGYFRKGNKETEQAYFILGGEGFPRNFHDATRLSLLTHVLGGGMSSRLFQKVREEKGLCYHITSYPSSYRDVGINSIVCSTSKERFAESLELILEEVKLFVDKGVTSQELKDAKTNHEGSLSIGYEHTESRMNNIAFQELYYGKYNSLENRIKEIHSVTEEEINATVRKIFALPELHLSVLAKLKAKEEQKIKSIFGSYSY